MAPKITATVLTRNEEEKLGRCLRTLRWVDEILVLDSGSTDATVAVAQRAGVRVEHQEWLGFARQKNRAAELAGNDWILNVDADERVGRDLAQAVRASPLDAPGYAVRRVNAFLGAAHRPVHRPREERLVRLYDRRGGAFGSDLVHEKVLLSGAPGAMGGTLYHEGFRSLEDMADRLNRYSSLSARQAGPSRPSSLRLVAKPLARLAWALVVRGAARDGARGVALAAFWAHHDLLVAAKRMEPALAREPVFADDLLALDRPPEAPGP